MRMWMGWGAGIIIIVIIALLAGTRIYRVEEPVEIRYECMPSHEWDPPRPVPDPMPSH